MKIITDEKKIDEILTRGVEDVFVKDKLREKLLSGKRLKIYLGIDPTGPTLHMGHAIPIKKLKEFQELGHQVILLMGDFTAMIGDPTDKTATRKQLTHKEVLNNLKKYKKQASIFLKFSGKNKAEFKFNSKWLAKLKFSDVLDLASKMTVDQMRKRDMFAKREEENKPILIHEFMYPLMQGYDSVAMNVDVEVGGNDQMFNMLTGRHLMSQILKKDKSVITMKLLEDNSGKKMGKTEGNMITFEDSSNDMFGKVMSFDDSLIIKGFELCTDVSLDQIKDFEKQMKSGINPKDLKSKLAYEIVKTYHGEKKAKEAEENWEKTFSKKEIPDEMEEIKVNKGELLVDVLVKNNIVSSKSEWRRLVEAKAVHNLIENKNIIDNNIKTTENLTLKIGKKRFIKILIK